MSFKYLYVLILALIVNFCNAAEILSGSGVESDPYLIQNVDEFLYFANSENSYLWEQGICVRLEDDIDLKGVGTFSQAPIAGDVDSDIGFDGVLYYGAFDGNGKTISNLSIDDSSFSSLFGMVGDSCVIKNLTMKNASITSKFYYGAAICGYNHGGTIVNCEAYGTVTGLSGSVYTGGICGFNYEGTIANCYAKMTISGHDYNGVICGRNSGMIKNCFSDGSVTGYRYAGGLCGRNNGTVTDSSSNAIVTGTERANSVGGFCGHNSGTISRCYSTGSASGRYYVGGLCGYNNSGDINCCYTTGSATGYGYVAGLCGFNYNGFISECLCDGSVSGSLYLAGLCGYNTYGGVSDSIWNVESSKMQVGCNSADSKESSETNIAGKTTDEMRNMSTFLSAGWDFVGEADNGTDDIWHMPYNSEGYPMLAWQKDIPGDIAGSYGVDIVDFWMISNLWLNEFTMNDLHVVTQYWLEGIE